MSVLRFVVGVKRVRQKGLVRRWQGQRLREDVVSGFQRDFLLCSRFSGIGSTDFPFETVAVQECSIELLSAATEHGCWLVLTRLPSYHSVRVRDPFEESWSSFGNQVISKYAALFNPPPEVNFQQQLRIQKTEPRHTA